MRLFKGDYLTLLKESYALAEAFGDRDVPGAYPTAAISAALIAQRRMHPAEFAAAVRSSDPHNTLMREAIRLDVPFWTLAYGLSVPVATSFEAVDERGMDALIRMGDLEPEVIEKLKAALERATIPSSRIYANRQNSPVPDWSSFDLRANLCFDVFHNADAYALLLSGVTQTELLRSVYPRQHRRVLAAIILGVPAEYAAKTRGKLDPQTILRAYREGVAPEYLGAL